MMRAAYDSAVPLSTAGVGGNHGQTSFRRFVSNFLDRATLYRKSRWICFFLLVALFVTRVLLVQGFFVVIYAHAIYLLNLFIGFVSPQVDRETGLVLPVREVEEYRPFQRKLPEFKFWLQGTCATVVALMCTFVPLFDLPVFWPILLIYFIALFVMTMKAQIKHMITHRYVPFSWGKQTYGDITRSRDRGSGGKRNSGKGRKLGLSFPSVRATNKTPSFAA